ncbi:hypothetical protein MIND_00751200 [Mycena indigotica]|uniref:Gem-associated protein 2 n=1 Tax=Mycena indigotica TaxID=2126181 RepID=A0A8H6SMP5_9AGAR|nr:uncharacterized protein MIND_00751200 [Mycena indigotica]KAF7301853.1 hypothetical protein MIND_00751200 [Mycena indigotica]
MSFVDSDDDDLAFGRQILPVASALPVDFDGVPATGEEYLLTVRRDARSLPHVTRVANPYALPEVTPPLPAGEKSSAALPSPEWCALYESRFRNFRKNLSQPTTHVSQSNGSRVMPEVSRRDCWWTFLAGKPREMWDPPPKDKGKGRMRAFSDDEADIDDSPVVPLEPTPAILLRIDHRSTLHLLMYFTHWMQQHPLQLRTSHFRWIFALLARLDAQLSSDELHQLRNLARAAIALLKHVTRAETELDASCCWIVIATVVHVWGQRDLWTDAADALAT